MGMANFTSFYSIQILDAGTLAPERKLQNLNSELFEGIEEAGKIVNIGTFGQFNKQYVSRIPLAPCQSYH